LASMGDCFQMPPVAKRSLAGNCVPKPELGNEAQRILR
jgi:hypothetical protein